MIMLRSFTFTFVVFVVFVCRIEPFECSSYDKFKTISDLSAPFDDQDRTTNRIPMVPKRAALLLDKLMVALQKAVGTDTGREVKSNEPYGWSSPDLKKDLTDYAVSDAKTMGLQRRGQTKGRIYWRCYFNAVSCFKRKR